jgi:hypothetical protein
MELKSWRSPATCTSMTAQAGGIASPAARVVTAGVPATGSARSGTISPAQGIDAVRGSSLGST